MNAALKTEAAEGLWEDSDGKSYRAILLNTKMDDDVLIAGVAMLTHIDDQLNIASVVQIASALAKILIKYGDVKGALAA